MLTAPSASPEATDPFDAKILDLVRSEETSVRLRNAIELAAKSGKLPFHTVEDYARAGDAAPLIASRRIDNLGQKTARELHDLVSRFLGPREDAAPRVNISAVLELIYSRIGDLATADAICDVEIPVRLKHALEASGYLHNTLVSNLRLYDDRIYDMARQPNVGRKSLVIWKNALAAALDNQLLCIGLDKEYSNAIKLYILDSAESGRLAGKILQTTSIPNALTFSTEASIIPPTNLPIQNVEELVAEALSTLGERERDVLARRFGLNGDKQTLEEVGAIYSLTRERIRQLEAKGLRQLKFRYGKRMRLSLIDNFGPAWNILAKNDVIASKDLDARRKLTPPHVLFGIELTDLSLQDCLTYYGVRRTDGWVSKTFPIQELDQAEDDLEAREALFQLPCPWPLLMPESSYRVAAVAIRLSGHVNYLGYVLTERPRPRMRRALRAHSILGSIGHPVEVVALLEIYRNRYSDDQCSSRDLDIVITSNPHLFIGISDGTWSSLGLPPPHAVEYSEQALRVDGDDELELSLASENLQTPVPLTNARALESALRRCGPLRLSELIERGPEFLPSGRAISSIGPTLLTNKDLFERPLPGLYALPGQVPPKNLILRSPPNYLLSEDQVRTYTFARWSGEPWGAFPLWCAEMEVAWCRWAREKCTAETLNSLLAIVDIDAWPVDNQEKEAWRALAVTRARFELQFFAREESFILPDLTSVLAACFVIKSRGALGWVGANRIMQRRLTDHTSIGLLAVLIGLGILIGAKHWQMRHAAGSEIDVITSKLTRVLQHGERLSWRSEIGSSLKHQIASLGDSFLASTWLRSEVLARILNSDIIAESPVESLLLALKVQEEENSFEALLESVLAGTVSSNGVG